MLSVLKKLFFYYQRSMWYAGQTGNEVGKPTRFLQESLQLATYLTVAGYLVKPTTLGMIYICILLAAVIIGKILAMLGVVKYNNTLNNKHNQELLTIMKKVDKLERLLKRLLEEKKNRV